MLISLHCCWQRLAGGGVLKTDDTEAILESRHDEETLLAR